MGLTNQIFVCYNTRMKNYVSKILITLGTLAFFMVGINFASAFTNSYDSTNCNVSWTTPIGCNNSSAYSQYNYNQPYDYNNNQQYAYNNNQYSGNQNKTPIVNNYYYQINPASKISTKTTSRNTSNSVKTNSKSNTNTVVKKKSPVVTKTVKTKEDKLLSKTNPVESYSGGLTALSLRSSNSFMPDTIWQWLIVIVLILIIVILTRLINKTIHRKKDHVTPVH